MTGIVAWAIVGICGVLIIGAIVLSVVAVLEIRGWGDWGEGMEWGNGVGEASERVFAEGEDENDEE